MFFMFVVQTFGLSKYSNTKKSMFWKGFKIKKAFFKKILKILKYYEILKYTLKSYEFYKYVA